MDTAPAWVDRLIAQDTYPERVEPACAHLLLDAGAPDEPHAWATWSVPAGEPARHRVVCPQCVPALGEPPVDRPCDQCGVAGGDLAYRAATEGSRTLVWTAHPQCPPLP